MKSLIYALSSFLLFSLNGAAPAVEVIVDEISPIPPKEGHLETALPTANEKDQSEVAIDEAVYELDPALAMLLTSAYYPLATQPTLQLELVDQKEVQSGSGNWQARFRLRAIQSQRPVTLSTLVDQRGAKLHALIINESLDDYQRVVARASAEEGIYEIEYRPLKPKSHYRLWVDTVPMATRQQELSMIDLPLMEESTQTTGASDSYQSSPHWATASYGKSEIEGLTFIIHMSTSAIADQTCAFDVEVKTDQGRSFQDLEPFLGQFASMIGFYGDFETPAIVLGPTVSPAMASSRAGPLLKFHFTPKRSGPLALFLHVRARAHDLVVPFVINVAP